MEIDNSECSLYCRRVAKKNPAAVMLGRKGGKKLAAERGPEYFRQLQTRRQTRAGGRPHKPR